MMIKKYIESLLFVLFFATFALGLGNVLNGLNNTPQAFSFQQFKKASKALNRLSQLDFSFEFSLPKMITTAEKSIAKKYAVKKKRAPKKIVFQKTIKKEFVVDQVNLAAPLEEKLIGEQGLTFYQISNADENLINDREDIVHHGFEIEETVEKVAWSDYHQKIEGTLVAFFESQKKNNEQPKVFDEGPVKQVVAGVEKSPLILGKFGESNKHQEFKNDELDLNNIAAMVINDRNKTKAKSENAPANELVFIDYSKKDAEIEIVPEPTTEVTQVEPVKVAAPQLAKPSESELKELLAQIPDEKVAMAGAARDDYSNISSAVQSVIQREMADSSAPKLAVVTPKKIIHDYSPSATQLLAREKSAAPVVSSKSKSEAGSYSRNTIKAYEVFLGNTVGNSVTNFDFIPDYDPNRTIMDQSGGSIALETQLSSSRGLMRGTLLKKDLVRTKIELTFEAGEYQNSIPMINSESFNEFLDGKGLRGQGGFLLIEMEEEVDQIDVDKNYEAKLFLNQKFEVVNEEGAYNFILYIGIEPGNALLSYKTLKNKIGERILFITEDEVTFIGSHFVESGIEEISLFERNVLSRSLAELSLDEGDVKYFNQNIKVMPTALNHYEYQRPIIPLGMRKYLEFNHLSESIYLGYWNSTDLEVPSQKFIEQVMGAHNIDQMEGLCLVQLNFKKAPSEVMVSGETIKGHMGLDQSYLDKDGLFSSEVTEMSDHAFIVGDMQGIINAKITYTDGTADFVQTFCSPSTYLIEQL